MKKEKKLSDVKLKSMGLNFITKESKFKKQRSEMESQISEINFPSEEDAVLSSQLENNKNENTTQAYQRFKVMYSYIEDPRKSSFMYQKIIVIEKLLFLLTSLIIFLSIFKTEIQTKDANQNSLSLEIENIMSFCILVLILLLIGRKKFIFELDVIQKKTYLSKSRDARSLWTFLQRSGRIRLLIFQILICLPHPISFLAGKTVQIYDSNDNSSLKNRVNNLLSILLLLKIYIILRSLVSISIFSSPRASRLCDQNGIQHSLLYSVKCILQEFPIRSILIATCILVITFGHAFKLSDGMLFLDNSNLSLSQFFISENCYWCAFITMTTIGYGDVYPLTLPGRIIATLAAITGVVLSSLLIVALSAYLKMNSQEKRAHITLLRLQEQQKLKLLASQAFTETIKMSNLLSKKNIVNLKNSQYKPMFTILKNKIDLTKAKNRKIKSMVPRQNTTSELVREFQLMRDYFKEIFKKQVKLKKTLQTMEDKKNENLKSYRESFLMEIEQIMKMSK